MLALTHHTKFYPGRSQAALDDVSFSLVEGERVAVFGTNGAGKSTFLSALQEAVRPSKNGTPGCVFVPADDPDDLVLSCRDYVMLGRTPHLSAWRRPTAEDEAAVERAMALVGVTAFSARRLNALSSGERRRLALAFAFATEAPVLLLDEPMAHLDQATRRLVYALLRACGRTVVMTVHELALPPDFFTRAVLFENGRLVADGPPPRVLASFKARLEGRPDAE